VLLAQKKIIEQALSTKFKFFLADFREQMAINSFNNIGRILNGVDE